MLKAFAVLIADETYGGQVFSMTPTADWKEVTGDDVNPNLISAAKYQVWQPYGSPFAACARENSFDSNVISLCRSSLMPT